MMIVNYSPFSLLSTLLLGLGILLTTLATASNAEEARPNIDNGVILLYHHVDTRTPAATSVSPETLREHMEYLSAHHQVMPLSDMVNRLRNGESLPDRAVAITFDDGFENILTNGHAILREFDFPYTIFINPALIGQEPHQLTWAQVKKMHSEGVSFANHTSRHNHLLEKQGDESEQQWLSRTIDDIQQAQQRLEQELGKVPKLLAYPYGEYNLQLADKIAELGYIGFGQHSGAISSQSDFRALPRFAAAGVYAEMKTLKTKLQSLAMPVNSRAIDDPQLSYEFRQPMQEIALDDSDFYMSQLACFYNGKAMTLSKQDNRVNLTLADPIRPGRSRINCTAPSKQYSGRYYWFSQPWFVPDKNGNWLD